MVEIFFKGLESDFYVGTALMNVEGIGLSVGVCIGRYNVRRSVSFIPGR